MKIIIKDVEGNELENFDTTGISFDEAVKKQEELKDKYGTRNLINYQLIFHDEVKSEELNDIIFSGNGEKVKEQILTIV